MTATSQQRGRAGSGVGPSGGPGAGHSGEDVRDQPRVGGPGGRVPVAILLVIAATGYAYERSDDVDDMAVTQITLLGP